MGAVDGSLCGMRHVLEIPSMVVTCVHLHVFAGLEGYVWMNPKRMFAQVYSASRARRSAIQSFEGTTTIQTIATIDT